MAKSVRTAQEWKEKGNEEFNKGNWSEALIHYTNALKLVKDNTEKGIYYKNRAAAYLKLHYYEKVIQDCNSALKICCNKALYRRCQALEALDRFEEAYRDAEIVISSDPNNKVIQLEATRLLELVQERRKENVSQMMDLAFNMSADNEKHKSAMINLLELARDEAGAEEIFKKEGVSKIAQLVEVERNEEVICSAIRILGELCQNNISRTESIVEHVGLLWCLEMMNSTSTERVNASQYCLQNILNSYSGMSKEPDSKPDEALCKAYKEEIDTILSCLLNSVTSRTITGLARDAIIQLIMRNIHCGTALNWAKRFFELCGLQKLMEVAGEMEEYKCESPMDITFSTRAIISVCLAKLYENMYYDTKEKFSNTINEFIKDKLLSPNTESKVRAVIAITTLIFGPIEIADAIIFKEGVVEMILAIAETDDVLEQKVVCECIVAAVTKYNEANVFICRGVKILEKLYQSKDDSVRVRALVGLCKLSRFEDTRCYVAIDPFANRATKTLAKVCRRFLINPKKEKDIRKWAIKGLSYLTCDDKVKEEFIEDQEAIQAMIELTKADDQSILHDVLMTLVNLCNAYEVQELPEMIELREFAGQHFPEKHVLAYDYCVKCNCTLAKAGVTTALVNLTKTNSQNCKELIARVFFVICGEQESKEIVIRQGGTKALLSLALDGTDRGKNYATRALVYLGRTKLLEVAFPGQIMMEVVGPIINLLNPECSVPENRMILGVLCDLAKVSDNMREHIFKEGVFQKIETFVYEQDYFFKFLSLLLINILVSSHEVAVQYFRQDNSRVKYLMLLCKDENQQFSRLAASILVMLTAANKEACKKVFDSESWLQSLRFLVTNPNCNIQKSGIIIVLNMMRSTIGVATKLMETDLMELLRSLSKNDNVENKIKALASFALGNVAERSSQEKFREAFINMNYSTVAKSVMTAHEWKEKGNEEFNKANWSKALSHYTNALKLKEDNAEKGLYYKNRAATYLKLRDYKKVVEDCDNALKICCNKALYRRCQALKALNRFEEACRDAEIIISSDSNNKVIQSVATRLLEIVQERRKESSYISDKVAQMLNLAFNVSADKEKRETAMHNLLVLARERAGAEEIFKKGVVFKIAQLVEVEKNEEVVCSAIRIVCELCQNNISRTESVVKYVCLPWCLEMMNSTSTERVNASQYCLQNILNAYSGMSKEPDSKPDKALCEAHKKEIDTILSYLLNNVTSRTITGLTRDAIIQLIMRNTHCVTALNWTERFVELRGLQKLMEVASEIEEYKYESSMDITFSTRAIISVCLAKIYENVYYDAAKKKFSNIINEFIKDKLLSPNTESKVRVVVAITTLIFGPLDVVDAIICKNEVVEMILAMAETGDLLQQKVVCECIVAAITKYNEVNVFIWRSRNILLNLYNSKHDSIRIRALVGLCKLIRFKDRLYSAIIRLRLSRDRATNKLAKICRRFLINPEKEEDMRKWAIKGLSYLTYDENIKDELIEDQQAIQAIIGFTKTDDQSVLYAVLTTLVNLCNAYVEQEHIPEMIEWETFIEHHFEGYDSVDEYAVKRRLNVLANAGVISALMSLANTDNQNYRELISRVFNPMCGYKKVSEIVIRQGFTKVLLSLALDGTDKGKNQALQALVRLGLTSTIRPKVGTYAFPGQMIMEIIRPIMNFLKPECSFWENYATLLVLCDLATVNDNIREHIFKEGVFQKIEAFLYEEDHRLRCASTTLINILVSSREIAVQYFRQDNSRVKYLTLLCKDENENISGSAASALASLTSSTKEACKKVFDSDSWLESLRFLVTNSNCDIQENGIVIVTNMMESTKDVAAKLMETDLMELLRALSKDDTVQNKRIKELAFIALEDAADRSNQKERREALLNMIRLDCDKARRSGQLDVLKFLQSELWVYEHTEYVSENIHSEFAGIQTRRRLLCEKKTKN